ncbi:MAG: bifunctional (p)ppGpp synthetase/guanosine-3',5'-bis(diphosphate) 3'-pyrophosphohydrolase [Planctomycetaceae bacterium]|nr:bifunctional (p)ppGpp synthetase/guanosine-3',5'-bis(diphosphate) 3'-pyrophosphohydrolase [Planctomycetaceae bacterium]
MGERDRQGLLAAADEFATWKHRHQFRRDGVTPYINHPRGVMAILRDEFGVRDVDTLAAGLLHDTIEDTATDYDEILERFGRKVADLVAVLTKDKRLPEAKRERDYFAQLSRASLPARLCKIADSLYNVRDSDAKHRPKAVLKARKLLTIYRGSRGLDRAFAILKQELAR